ncbi:MAG: hypothetical protein AAF633_27515, partial [Chloroflexota bacterium]
MTEAPDPDSNSRPDSEDTPDDVVRCPSCDFVVLPGQSRCLMCGDILPASLFAIEPEGEDQPAEVPNADVVDENRAEQDDPVVSPTVSSVEAEPQSDAKDIQNTPLFAKTDQPNPSESAKDRSTDAIDPKPIPSFVRQAPIEKGSSRSPRSTALVGMIILFVLITMSIGAFAFLNPDAIPIVMIASPTPQEIVFERPTASPTATNTPTVLPVSPTSTLSPTATTTPPPTSTPQPPRAHNLESGQTLVGVAVLYGITLDSILSLNNFTTESI